MSEPAMPAPGASSPQATGPRAVAADRIEVAITGDGARLVMLPPEAVRWAQEITAPPGATHLPGSASGVFMGREHELTQLHSLLKREGEAAVTQGAQTQAIHGMGGIGKSALALHYAHAYRHSYTLVWWITAESTEQIVTGLATLAVRLCPHWAVAASVEERAAWAIAWLQWHPGWLLIFDNVENPDILRHYLGALPGGYHLATSRRAAGWHAIAPTITLGLLAPDASADLLCRLALGQGLPANPRQRRHAEQLAAEMGYLPLALEQAGAYMVQTGTDLGTYRELLGRVLDRAADGIDGERTIARVWQYTLTAIEARDALAISVLRTMAWLAPENVPRTLLTPLAPDPLALGDALGVLHAYNMISFTADQQGINVHRLLQAVLRTHIQHAEGPSLGGRSEAEQVLCRAVYPYGTDQEPNATQWDLLMPHVLALATSTPRDHRSDTALLLWMDAAYYLSQQGNTVRAIPLYAAVLAQRELALGDSHPETLTSRNTLAFAYVTAGDLDRAIPLCKATLAQYEQVLGATHPGTLACRDTLAYAYMTAGDLDRAIPLCETTLAQRELVLGDMHPDTLTSRNNLAITYVEAGNLEQAIPLYETTLAQRELVLGDTHPDTLTSRSTLANAHRAAGDVEMAIALHETTLAQCRQVLGDAHPGTLLSRSDLAVTYVEAGNPERAIPLYEATLTQRERVLGDTHPDTLNSRNNLAWAYVTAGDFGRAISLYEATLTQQERILGD